MTDRLVGKLQQSSVTAIDPAAVATVIACISTRRRSLAMHLEPCIGLPIKQCLRQAAADRICRRLL